MTGPARSSSLPCLCAEDARSRGREPAEVAVAPPGNHPTHPLREQQLPRGPFSKEHGCPKLSGRHRCPRPEVAGVREFHDDDPGFHGDNMAISKLHLNSVPWTVSLTFWVQILALPLTWRAQKGSTENLEAERWRGVNPHLAQTCGFLQRTGEQVDPKG